MDISSIFDISAAGMNLERMRLEVSALNLANANTTRGADGQPFSPLQVVVHSGMTPFDAVFNALSGTGLHPPFAPTDCGLMGAAQFLQTTPLPDL